MKRIMQFFILAGLLLMWGEASAQGTSLTVIADEGEKFTLEVNNSMQNSTPESRVTATNLWGPSIKVKIYIEGAQVAPVSKSIFYKPNADFYYVLHRNAKGVYVIDPVSASYEPSVKESSAAATPAAKETKATENKAAKETKEAKGNGCSEPLTADEFVPVYASVSARPFEGTRLSGAKTVVVDKCVTVSQLLELLYLLDLETSRLDLAKYAYVHIYDPGNYSDVDAVFRSASSVESLHKYINSKQ